MRLALALVLFATASARADDWWLDPIERATGRVIAFDEDDRAYSTGLRPRDLGGFIGISCEHQEGRPCGRGEGFLAEVDSAAGYGDDVSADVRLRARAGTTLYGNGVDVDRAHVNARLGPAAIEIGRDVLAIGPRARTQLAWGDNAAPLDQVRVATATPYPLGDDLHGSLLYVIGRIRDSAQQHPPLVTIARAQLDVGRRVEIGVHQELMLGGDGAPSFGVLDFIEEHFTRRDASASATDSSNRRFGGDVTLHLHDARIYYALVFEDIRTHVIDALHYDADHLLGVETRGVTVELVRTGVRSYEHVPQRTQFENAGRVVGAPLGPDVQSIYAAWRARAGDVEFEPWIELARLSSDTYTFVVDGPIERSTAGTPEDRYRIGARVGWSMTRELRGEFDPVYEHVSQLGFDPSASRDNLGMMLVFVWQPGGFVPH